MKLFYPTAHYNKEYRGLVFPLLKPFIKGKGFTDKERISLYGLSEKDFKFTQHLEEADIAILTMAWNYYISRNQESLAIDFIKKCDNLNKKVITFNAGDFGVRIPSFENLVVLRPSGYKSKFTDNEFPIPPFIADPLKKYFQTDKIFQRTYKSKPVIGFCGQANSSFLNAANEIIKTAMRNVKSYVGFSNSETQQLLSTSFVRASVLKKLQQCSLMETNFILRKKYRAGIIEQKDTHSTTLEFYNNLKNSDYVVCVRGAGNFSVRFYEALAMGRIPILINTDCSLPFNTVINWKKHVVWVEYRERKLIAEKVLTFHKNLTLEQFQDLQEQNRRLWFNQLTLCGYFEYFLKSMKP